MGLPSGYPATDATFNSVAFLELHPDFRYEPYAQEEETTIVGQTVITRYTKPKEVTVLGLAGTSDAASIEGFQGTSHSLVWHRGTNTALLKRCETKKVRGPAVVELTMTFIL
jgi:hypothetical protein